jgi:hypothetical protein
VRLRILSEAIEDARQAFDYYESQRKGLGAEYALETANAIRRIIDAPEAWQILGGRIRRCMTKRFP